MKLKTIAVTGLVVVLAGLAAWAIWMKGDKIAYVKTFDVYNEFTLKKELESELKKTELHRQVLLDSLKSQIQMAMINPGALNALQQQQRLNLLEENYARKEQEYAEQNSAQAKKYTDEIWQQLNQYIKDYGKEQGYTYILGATGEGNLMYANEAKDITKAVSEYVNTRYKGR